MTEKRKLGSLHIAVYLIIFFAIWTVRELVIQPVFLSSLDALMQQILGQTIKLLVWTLPAILLIRHFRDDMLVGLKEMFFTKPQWFKDAYILLLVFVPFLGAWIASGQIAIDPDLEPTRLIGAVFFVGITEEIVFRGFLLNAFLKRMKMPYAVALDAVLFTLIHYPIWIYRGHDFSVFLTNSIAVLLISAFFAYSFIKTRNILVPIALHMIWNLLTIVFVR